jgi:hypothetical protein
MDEHWTGQFVVRVPDEEEPFCRLVTSHSPDEADFQPDSALRKRHSFEDQCCYHGLSAWDNSEQAFEHAADINRARERRSLKPFSHVAQFAVKPKRRHAVSAEHPPTAPGHHIVWGRADELSSRLIDVLPIPEPED